MAGSGSIFTTLREEPAVQAPITLHAATLQSLAESLQELALQGTLGGMLLHRPPAPGATVAVTADEQPRRTERADWPRTAADEWFLIVTGVDYPLVLCGQEASGDDALVVLCSTEPSVANRAAAAVLDQLERTLPDQPALPRTAPSPAGLCDFLVVMLLGRLDAAERRAVSAASDILDVLEAERSRIAKALHDGPVQELTAALLFLDGATLGAGQVDPTLVARGSDALRSAVASCRAMMDSLAPPTSDLAGLPARLAHMVEMAAPRGDVTVQVQTPEQLGLSDPALGLDIYRVVEALLDNVRRHAGGALRRVSVTREGGEIVAVVADAGSGGAADANDGVGGLALVRHSVERHSGRLQIASGPAGTVVTARWPAPPGSRSLT